MLWFEFHRIIESPESNHPPTTNVTPLSHIPQCHTDTLVRWCGIASHAALGRNGHCSWRTGALIPDLHPAKHVGWWRCALSAWRALLLVRLGHVETGRALKACDFSVISFLTALTGISILHGEPPTQAGWLCAAQWGHELYWGRPILTFQQLTSSCSPGHSASHSYTCLYHVKRIAGLKALFNSYFIPHLPAHIELVVYMLLCHNEKDLYFVIKSRF